MDHPQLPIQFSPNTNSHPQYETETVRIEQSQLNSLIASYYAHMNANSLNNFASKFTTEFSAIQQQIIGVVQMRKDMEKTVELDVVQSQHFTTIQKLIEQNLHSQKVIESLSLKIKQQQSKDIGELLKLLQERLKSVEYTPNICLDNQIKMLANQISRSFLGHSSVQTGTSQANDFQIQNNQFDLKIKNQDQFNWIIKEQNEKYELLKSIYGCKFREISIRDQLISQRQTAFFDYSTSNHELIDALLRQKEREKNLNRTQRQKFEELLKARHQIELENQHLSYHQNNLISYYEIELLRLKQLIKEKQNSWNAQKQLILAKQNGKNGEIQKLLSIIELLTKQKDELTFTNLDFKQTKNDVQAENKKLQQSLKHAIMEKNQYQQKMESLQSQLNQNILKLSQGNRTKAEFAQKLQEANKRTTDVQQYSSTLKDRLAVLQSERDKLSTKNTQMHGENQANKQKIQLQLKQKAVLQQKILYLQDELTQIFITNNALVKKLQEQTRQKTKLIQKLQHQNQCLHNKQQQKRLIQSNHSLELKLQEENQLKGQLRDQIQRQSVLKQKLLDETIERISKLLY